MTGPAMALDGPRLPPEGGRSPRRLVVLLHGIGADGHDLIGLAPLYRRVLPDAAFVAPHAPFAYDLAPFGRMWFSIADLDRVGRLEGVRRVQPLVDAFLDAELARLRLGGGDLVLVGFSQGAMVALHVGLRRAVPPAAILSHSGMLLGDAASVGEWTGRPPVLLTHGAADDVLPPACLPASEAGLKAAGVPVEAHLVPGLGHGIDEATLRLALEFLARRVPAAEG